MLGVLEHSLSLTLPMNRRDGRHRRRRVKLPLPTAKRGEKVRGEGLLLISTDDTSHWARGKSSSSPLTLSSIFQMEERELSLGPVRWSTLPSIADDVCCGSGAQCVNRFCEISPHASLWGEGMSMCSMTVATSSAESSRTWDKTLRR